MDTIPIVIAFFGTSSSLAKKREFAFIVLSCRSTTWVLLTKFVRLVKADMNVKPYA